MAGAAALAMERLSDEELHRDVGQLLKAFPGLQLPDTFQVSIVCAARAG